MIAILGVLLLVWIIVAVLGFVVKGFIWLAIIAIVLFIATSIFGWVQRKTSR